jgi:hypothetical protein
MAADASCLGGLTASTPRRILEVMRFLWIIAITSLVAGCDSGFKATEDASSAKDGGSEASSADLEHDLLASGCPGAVQSEDVDTKHEPGSYSSIAVEDDGTIHVSHIATGPTPGPMGGDWHDARYSVRRGGTWTSEDIYTPGVLGQFTALGVGPDGKVHVIFYSYSTRDLVYAWRGSQSWSTEVLKTSYSDGWGSDLAVDGSGAVHVITFKGASGTIDGEWHYLRRVGTKWDSPVVLQTMAGGNGPKSGITVAKDNTVHVSFSDADGKLKYRSGKDGAFNQAQTLDTGLGQSCSSDIALDGQGQVHISYYDSTQKRLRYIGQVGGIFGSPRDLDSAGTVGSYNAVAATDKGDLWVGYYDFTNQDLKLIRRQNGSWGKPETVDSAGHVGRQVSAAVGPSGALHLSHYNVSVNALRHTRVCP